MSESTSLAVIQPRPTIVSLQVNGSDHITVSVECPSCSSTPLSEKDLATLADLITSRLNQYRFKPAANKELLRKGGKHAPRAKTGCATCKERKVKCDERQPICGNCRKDPSRKCVYEVKFRTIKPRHPPMTAPLTHVHTHFNPRQEESNIPARNNSTSAITPLHAVVAPTSNISSLDASTHGGQLTEANTASLFFHGISFISSPTLINIRSRQTPARTERILVLLWEAFLLAKADQERVSHALVEATCAIGAVKLAFSEAKNGAASPKHCLERSKMIMNSVFQLVNKESAGPIHDSERQEKVLALTQLMMLRDAYVGDPDWLNTYRFCAKYVAEQGGPANIIHAAQMSSSRPHIERFLAYLTVYETLGAFSTKEAPVLLSCPNSLWLEDLPCAQEIMHADFGFSLPTLFLIANLAGIVASGETSDCLESQSLFTSLDTTHLATISSTPSPVRIQFGDLLMRHSLICHLLLVVYSFHRSHARIQQAGSAILELLVEVTIWTGSMINLLHPLLMAGEVIPKEQRHILELILGTAREKADTADVDAIHAVIKECWHRRDNGTGEETVFDVIGCAPPTNIL